MSFVLGICDNLFVYALLDNGVISDTLHLAFETGGDRRYRLESDFEKP